jgi:hypothetical protein
VSDVGSEWPLVVAVVDVVAKVGVADDDGGDVDDDVELKERLVLVDVLELELPVASPVFDVSSYHAAREATNTMIIRTIPSSILETAFFLEVPNILQIQFLLLFEDHIYAFSHRRVFLSGTRNSSSCNITMFRHLMIAISRYGEGP